MDKSIEGAVLVTGGAGYIGGQTVLTLLDAGIEVCVIDDLSTGSMRPFHADTHFYQGRIHEADLLQAIFARHPITSIMHFAGSIKVDESVYNPLKYYDNNTEGSRILTAAAADAGVENFIFSSTAAVYGETGDAPVTEDAVPAPLNPYGRSKLFTEQLLKDICRVSSMRYGILRYFNVAGADPSLRHGQFLERPSHLIGRAIDAMIGKAPPLMVFGNDLPTADGTGVRDYIHVHDVAGAHLALLFAMQQRSDSFLLNLGYGNGSSVFEVISALEQEVGDRVPHQVGAPRPGEAPSVIADVSKLHQTLNWQPEHDELSIMLRSAYDWAVRKQEQA